MNQVRILVADDHEATRRGIRELLEANPGWQVCGEAATGKEALQKAKQLKPNVVVMDITLPELSGLEATREILKAVPHTEVLIFTLHESEEVAREVLAAGARAYVLKSDDGRELVAAVEALRQHRPFFSTKASELILKTSKGGPSESPDHSVECDILTAREKEIVSLLAAGNTNKEVAAALSISINTVETHRNNIMHKLNLHSIIELVHWAIRKGIVSPQDPATEKIKRGPA